MLRTTVGHNRRERGFTYLEMSAVIVILMAVTTLVAMNLTTIERARDLYDLKANLLRMGLDAKNEAMTKNEVVRLKLNGDNLEMETGTTSSDTQTLKQVDYGNFLTLQGQRVNGDTKDEGDWKWAAYPDGTADKASLIFRDGSKTVSLVFTDQGRAHWVDGEPPDPRDDEWNAGELETRE